MHRTCRTSIATLAAAALSLTLAAPARATTDPPHFEELAVLQVGGTYTPVVGNFSDEETEYDDLLWYAPGAGTEHLWTNAGDKQFTSKSLGNKVNGAYTPIVGDFTGDLLDDILWYAPGPAADVMWQSSGKATFTNVAVNISGTYTPVVLDDEDNKDDILWVVPGGGTGSVWSFTGTGSQHASHPATSVGGTLPLTGDFDGDEWADVFWYGPAGKPDAVWYGNGSGTFVAKAQTVAGTYKPVVDGLDIHIGPKFGGTADTDDILWYRTGAPAVAWYGNADRTWLSQPAGTFTTTGTPLPAPGAGHMWVWSPTQPDQVWSYGEVHATNNTELGTGYTPVLGDWYGGGHEIVFYKPGPAPEVLFL